MTPQQKNTTLLTVMVIVMGIIVNLLINIVTGGTFIPLGPAWFFLLVAVIIEIILVLAQTSGTAAPHSTSFPRLFPIFILIVIISLLWFNIPQKFLSTIGTTNNTSENTLHRTNSTNTSNAPYPPESSTLVFSDPLNKPGRWPASSPSCSFMNDGFYVSFSEQLSGPGAGSSCGTLTSPAAPGNFAFEVQMEIAQGYCGGVDYELGINVPDRTYEDYDFIVCQDQTYQVVWSGLNGPSKALITSTSSSIHSGLHKRNLLALVANGNTHDFYVNRTKVYSANFDDRGASDGSLNFDVYIALPLTKLSISGSFAKVIYKNAILWKL